MRRFWLGIGLVAATMVVYWFHLLYSIYAAIGIFGYVAGSILIIEWLVCRRDWVQVLGVPVAIGLWLLPREIRAIRKAAPAIGIWVMDHFWLYALFIIGLLAVAAVVASVRWLRKRQ